MAADIVIRAEGLGKKYLIGHEAQRERYVALRDVIARGARNIRRMAADMLRGQAVIPGDSVEEVWALKEVNFEVRQGEVLGIIGRNGAGKSTLLKVLSRITDPSEGRVAIKGRVASLLEVGTGFHSELTGRENIYLNGAILGMARSEIKRKFDEIVAFAEVERFLDTPVKRYSSGMYVRLAFAVAAHLEPDILVVDEVLAVGDAEFQKKCLGKMGEVAGGGRTVLFVSHNMAAVQQLCSRGILLSLGRIQIDDATAVAVTEYLSSAHRGGIIDLEKWPDRITSGEATITRLEIGSDGMNSVLFGKPIEFRFYVNTKCALMNPIFGIIIHDYTGYPITCLQSHQAGFNIGNVAGEIGVEARIESCILYPGRYFLSPWIMDSMHSRDIDFPRMCAELNVADAPGEFGSMHLDAAWGKVHISTKWRCVNDKDGDSVEPHALLSEEIS